MFVFIQIDPTKSFTATFVQLGLFSTSAQYVRIVANMSTFCISAQYVRMNLKEPLMYKSCPKWLCWVYLDANKHFHRI